MAKIPEILLPGMEPVALRLVNEQDYAYFSDVFPSPEQHVRNSWQIDRSLIRFAKHISGEQLTEFMQAYIKADSNPRKYIFSVEPVFRRYSYRRVGEGISSKAFFLDSRRGLALVTSDKSHKEKSGIAVIGFDFGNEVDSYGTQQFGNPLVGSMDFQHPLPVIVQLQSARLISKDELAAANSWDAHANAEKRVLEVLESYKWERALIGILLEWAMSENIPAVYLAPAAKNCWKYRFEDADTYNRLKLRYDVSAQRMGFRMQPNGLYGISLLPGAR